MLGLFQRPKLVAGFVASEAISNEFTREINLAGHLEVKNEGSDAELSSVDRRAVDGSLSSSS